MPRLRVNIASAEELMLLPAIGVVRSRKIMEHRQRFGRINTLQQLGDICELSPSQVRRLRAFVSFSDSSSIEPSQTRRWQWWGIYSIAAVMVFYLHASYIQSRFLGFQPDAFVEKNDRVRFLVAVAEDGILYIWLCSWSLLAISIPRLLASASSRVFERAASVASAAVFTGCCALIVLFMTNFYGQVWPGESQGGWYGIVFLGGFSVSQYWDSRAVLVFEAASYLIVPILLVWSTVRPCVMRSQWWRTLFQLACSLGVVFWAAYGFESQAVRVIVGLIYQAEGLFYHLYYFAYDHAIYGATVKELFVHSLNHIAHIVLYAGAAASYFIIIGIGVWGAVGVGGRNFFFADFYTSLRTVQQEIKVREKVGEDLARHAEVLGLPVALSDVKELLPKEGGGGRQLWVKVRAVVVGLILAVMGNALYDVAKASLGA